MFKRALGIKKWFLTFGLESSWMATPDLFYLLLLISQIDFGFSVRQTLRYDGGLRWGSIPSREGNTPSRLMLRKPR